jgi:hypothetical protein
LVQQETIDGLRYSATSRTYLEMAHFGGAIWIHQSDCDGIAHFACVRVQ